MEIQNEPSIEESECLVRNRLQPGMMIIYRVKKIRNST